MTMDDGTTRQPKKRLPEWLHWLLIGTVIALAVPLTVLGATVLFNLLRPVELPAELRPDAPRILAKRGEAVGQRSASGIVHSSATTATSATQPAVETPAKPAAGPPDEPFIPERFIHNEAQRKQAAQATAMAQRLRDDLDQFERDRVSMYNNKDFADPNSSYWNRRRQLWFKDYYDIQRLLRDGIDPALEKRWNDAFLRMLVENQDWEFVWDFCKENIASGSIENWDTAVYACRQMPGLQGGVKLGVLGLVAVIVRVRML
jgi:hypothetical protein